MAKGKNDYLKGNRTTTNRNTAAIQELNTKYSEDIERYRFFASQRRKSRKHSQESMTGLIDKLFNYVEGCEKSKQPLTVAGTILALGIDRNTWSRAKDGELDYLLEEYLEVNNVSKEDISIGDNGFPCHINPQGEIVTLIPFSELREKSDLLIQQQREIACSSLRGNPAGNIFLLKAQMGFTENDSPSSVTQNLIIADSEQAKKAISMLK